MRDVTDASFESDVLAARAPVVVDFWAPWCGPCKAIHPILETLERELAGRVEFVRVDLDANPETGARCDVLSLPTVIVFEAGEARETVVGARSRKHFERVLAPWLGAAA